MRPIWIAGFTLLMVVCALCVSNAAGAPAQPPLKVLVWVDKTTYGLGETANINYLVTRSAEITINIKKPDGTEVNFGPKQANPNTVLKQPLQGSQPTGLRQVTLTATANDGSKASDSTSYEVAGLAQGFTLQQDQGQEQTGDLGQQNQLIGGDQGQEQQTGDQGQEQPPFDEGQQYIGDQGQGQPTDEGQGLTEG